jgi:hypothetical protein
MRGGLFTQPPHLFTQPPHREACVSVLPMILPVGSWARPPGRLGGRRSAEPPLRLDRPPAAAVDQTAAGGRPLLDCSAAVAVELTLCPGLSPSQQSARLRTGCRLAQPGRAECQLVKGGLRPREVAVPRPQSALDCQLGRDLAQAAQAGQRQLDCDIAHRARRRSVRIRVNIRRQAARAAYIYIYIYVYMYI